jgi:hypothetical protein
MTIKEMFYIPIKLKPELARASMTTSDVNNQFPTANNHGLGLYILRFYPSLSLEVKFEYKGPAHV